MNLIEIFKYKEIENFQLERNVKTKNHPTVTTVAGGWHGLAALPAHAPVATVVAGRAERPRHPPSAHPGDANNQQ